MDRANWSGMWEGVEVLEPSGEQGLEVFGLRLKSESPLHYATLDEAMAAGTLDVVEVSAAGSVPTLKVSNRGLAMVFLMSGEQLLGAKQNRVINASLMIAPKSTILAPVSCVESGRWRYKSEKFESGGTMSHGMLRRMMSKQADAGYRADGSPTSDQQAVWSEVARKMGAMGTFSGSAAFAQVYDDHWDKLDGFVKRLSAPEGCQGVAFAVGGRIAGADLFDQPSTLKKLWSKLIRSYALDALELKEHERAGTVAREGLARWVRQAGVATCESFPSPGLGRDLRFRDPAMTGSALVVDEQPVHVELFSEPGRAR